MTDQQQSAAVGERATTHSAGGSGEAALSRHRSRIPHPLRRNHLSPSLRPRPYLRRRSTRPRGRRRARYAQIAREMLAAHSDACHAVNAKMVPRSLRPRGHPGLLPLHRWRHRHPNPLRPAMARKTRPLLLASHELLQRVRRLRLDRPPSLLLRHLRPRRPRLPPHAPLPPWATSTPPSSPSPASPSSASPRSLHRHAARCALCIGCSAGTPGTKPAKNLAL